MYTLLTAQRCHLHHFSHTWALPLYYIVRLAFVRCLAEGSYERICTWPKMPMKTYGMVFGYHYVLNISYIVSHSLGWGVILITWPPLPVWLRWTHCFYDYMISYVVECWKISSGKPLATQTASRLVMLDWAISLYYTTTHSKPLLVTFKWSHANNCVFPTLV